MVPGRDVEVASRAVSELDDTHPAIEQAFALGGDRHAIADYYDRWAENYDADVGADEYGVRDVIVDMFLRLEAVDFEPADRTIEIIDAGCGTGQIGARLAKEGFQNIDGVDLSPAMVSKAEQRGIYRRLAAGFDMTEPIANTWFQQYDACFVGGVFTLGHAPPETLANIIDLVRPGGALLVSVREAYYDSTAFAMVHEQLVLGGLVTVLNEVRGAKYTLDSVGHYFAYRVEQL